MRIERDKTASWRSGRDLATASLLFLGLTGAACGAGLFEDLWEKVEKIRQPDTVEVLPESAQGAATQIQRVLGGISPQEEQAVGRRAAGNLLGAAPLVKNASLQKYVNRVGVWVALQSERPDLAWHFGVIESQDINAFAAPGGYVFITRGLYRQLRGESELAGVLAHEIAHVVQKHHLNILEQSRLLDQGGKVLSGQVAGSEQIKRLIGTGAEIFSRALDKNAEYEADRLAMVLAARAGYDPFGLPAVLQDLAHLSREDRSVSMLFKTHPHPDERLAQMEDTGQRLDGIRGKINRKRFERFAL
ncbi:MAG: M48 family metalloprotease [Immundisolibacter sp.]|uniref:M48 family metalloprotease n=1 Tax=Immundisolibacter sp. TaxID=1934948 RepID=UPI003EE41691